MSVNACLAVRALRLVTECSGDKRQAKQRMDFVFVFSSEEADICSTTRCRGQEVNQMIRAPACFCFLVFYFFSHFLHLGRTAASIKAARNLSGCHALMTHSAQTCIFTPSKSKEHMRCPACCISHARGVKRSRPGQGGQAAREQKQQQQQQQRAAHVADHMANVGASVATPENKPHKRTTRTSKCHLM